MVGQLYQGNQNINLNSFSKSDQEILKWFINDNAIKQAKQIVDKIKGDSPLDFKAGFILAKDFGAIATVQNTQDPDKFQINGITQKPNLSDLLISGLKFVCEKDSICLKNQADKTFLIFPFKKNSYKIDLVHHKAKGLINFDVDITPQGFINFHLQKSQTPWSLAVFNPNGNIIIGDEKTSEIVIENEGFDEDLPALYLEGKAIDYINGDILTYNGGIQFKATDLIKLGRFKGEGRHYRSPDFIYTLILWEITNFRGYIDKNYTFNVSNGAKTISKTNVLFNCPKVMGEGIITQAMGDIESGCGDMKISSTQNLKGVQWNALNRIILNSRSIEITNGDLHLWHEHAGQSKGFLQTNHTSHFEGGNGFIIYSDAIYGNNGGLQHLQSADIKLRYNQTGPIPTQVDSTKYVVQSVILYETSGYAKSFNQIHQSLSQKSAYANFQGTFQPSYNFENVSFGFDTNSTRSTFGANFTSSSGVNPFNSNSGPAQAFKILAGGIHQFNQLQEQNRQINTVGLLIKGIKYVKQGCEIIYDLSKLGAGVFGVKAVIDTKKALKNKGPDFKGTPDDPDDEDENAWSKAPVKRGQIIEKKWGQNLPQNYKTIDHFDFDKTGKATSYKSLDLNAKTYQNPNQLHSRLKGYVDKVADFRKGRLDGVIIEEHMIKSRGLDVAIPHAGNSEQQQVMNKIAEYAKNKGVEFNSKIFK